MVSRSCRCGTSCKGDVQTDDYARALFFGGLLNPSEDAIDQLVAAGLARQSIFDRPDPPNVWIVLDEVLLTG